MNEKKVKKLRSYMKTNLIDLLVLVRNEFGEKTEKMSERNLYQNAKKLYYNGKLPL